MKRISFLFVVLFLTFAVYAVPCFAAPNLFEPYVAYSVGSWPESIAIGDVNGDGRNDVVMATSRYFDAANDYHIFVFLQNPTGALDPPVKYPAGNGESVDIGDVNNDGKDDVIVTAINAIGVFIQNTTGTLDPMLTYPSNHSSHSNTHKLKTGDFNNDGLLDVVSIDWGTQSQAVDVFLQNTGGTLATPVSYIVAHGGYDDLDVGDVNNDGLTDIIVMSGQGYAYDNFGIIYQNSSGTFGAPVYYDLSWNTNVSGVSAGDVNGDGLNDVVLTGGAMVAVFQQNDSGTLDDPTFYNDGAGEPNEIGDINGDGLLDVVAAQGPLQVYLQDTSGSLAYAGVYTQPYSTHLNPHGLAIGDINSDGYNDVVIANYNYGLVVLYRATPAPTISVSPSPAVFGPVVIADSFTHEITVSNTDGTAELNVRDMQITGPDAAEFSIDENGGTTPCGSLAPIIAVGGSCTITVTFRPQTAGIKTGALEISSDDPDDSTLSVALTGAGALVSGPEIRVTDTVEPDTDLRIPFGNVTEGISSDETITITNEGTEHLQIGALAQSDAIACPFSIETDGCSSRTLASGQSCTVTVRFSPTSVLSYNDHFDIPSNDADESTITIYISGAGLSSARNNPPSAPQLIYPAVRQTDVETPVTFRWKASADPDGDPVTYDLYVCEDKEFTGCEPVNSTPIAAHMGAERGYRLAGTGLGMLFIGVAVAGGIGRRKQIALLLVGAIAAVALLVSCGGDGGGRSNEVTFTVSDLDSSTTCFWKVEASDGKDTTSSVRRRFTTK